jgi:predicted RNA-binding Zn-ribbon protein involved in translation (DUF1610 family)
MYEYHACPNCGEQAPFCSQMNKNGIVTITTRCEYCRKISVTHPIEPVERESVSRPRQ